MRAAPLADCATYAVESPMFPGIRSALCEVQSEANETVPRRLGHHTHDRVRRDHAQHGPALAESEGQHRFRHLIRDAETAFRIGLLLERAVHGLISFLQASQRMQLEQFIHNLRGQDKMRGEKEGVDIDR